MSSHSFDSDDPAVITSLTGKYDRKKIIVKKVRQPLGHMNHSHDASSLSDRGKPQISIENSSFTPADVENNPAFPGSYRGSNTRAQNQMPQLDDTASQNYAQYYQYGTYNPGSSGANTLIFHKSEDLKRPKGENSAHKELFGGRNYEETYDYVDTSSGTENPGSLKTQRKSQLVNDNREAGAHTTSDSDTSISFNAHLIDYSGKTPVGSSFEGTSVKTSKSPRSDYQRGAVENDHIYGSAELSEHSENTFQHDFDEGDSEHFEYFGQQCCERDQILRHMALSGDISHHNLSDSLREQLSVEANLEEIAEYWRPGQPIPSSEEIEHLSLEKNKRHFAEKELKLDEETDNEHRSWFGGTQRYRHHHRHKDGAE